MGSTEPLVVAVGTPLVGAERIVEVAVEPNPVDRRDLIQFPS